MLDGALSAQVGSLHSLHTVDVWLRQAGPRDSQFSAWVAIVTGVREVGAQEEGFVLIKNQIERN